QRSLAQRRGLSAEMIMKYTMKVYKNSPDYHTFLKARFDKSNSGQSFEWAGHRWAYEVTSFDDTGDYELLYRFDDKPYQEEVSVTTDDMTIRDYFAAKALGLCFAQYLNHAEAEGFQDGWRDGVAADAYQMADAMLRAREAS
ncbi:hypothetical protein, partial [Citrobacter freundii]